MIWALLLLQFVLVGVLVVLLYCLWLHLNQLTRIEAALHLEIRPAQAQTPVQPGQSWLMSDQEVASLEQLAQQDSLQRVGTVGWRPLVGTSPKRRG